MRGSKFPDSDSERMCPHCGGWFDSRGWAAHKRNCPREHRQANFDPERPPEQGGKGYLEDDPDDDLEDAEPHPQTDGEPMDEGATHTPDVNDTPTPSESGVETDGGGLDLEGPPKPSTSSSAAPDPSVDNAADLPDRYVTIPQFVNIVQRELDQTAADMTRNELNERPVDVVDVEKTTRPAQWPTEKPGFFKRLFGVKPRDPHIVAYALDEVPI